MVKEENIGTEEESREGKCNKKKVRREGGGSGGNGSRRKEINVGR